MLGNIRHRLLKGIEKKNGFYIVHLVPGFKNLQSGKHFFFVENKREAINQLNNARQCVCKDCLVYKEIDLNIQRYP